MKAHTVCLSNKTQEPFADRHEALCVCTDGNTTCTKCHWKPSCEDGAIWSRSAILLTDFRVLKANPKADYRGVDLDHIVSTFTGLNSGATEGCSVKHTKLQSAQVFGVCRQMPWVLLLEHQTQCTSGNDQARIPLLSKASRHADEQTENDKDNAAELLLKLHRQRQSFFINEEHQVNTPEVAELRVSSNSRLHTTCCEPPASNSSPLPASAPG